MRTTIITAPGLSLLGSAAQAFAADKAKIDTFGFDIAGMDRTIAPVADFYAYAYADGGWARTTLIPPDRSTLSTSTRLDDLNRRRVTAVLVLTDEPRGDATARADALLALERTIARVSWSAVDSRDAARTYCRRTRAQFRTPGAGFDTERFLLTLGARTSARKLDAWYGAFGVEPGERLYLPPDQCVRIW